MTPVRYEVTQKFFGSVKTESQKVRMVKKTDFINTEEGSEEVPETCSQTLEKRLMGSVPSLRRKGTVRDRGDDTKKKGLSRNYNSKLYII